MISAKKAYGGVFVKKTLACLSLCFAFLFSMALVAFATTVSTDNGTDSAVVKGNYVGPEEPGTVYSVEITWGSMEFTYDDGTVQNIWDPETHQYSSQSVTGGQGWICNNKANEVTVVNKSNAALQVNVTTAITNQAVGTISAKVTVNNAETDAFALADASQGATTRVAGTASQGTAVVTLSGTPNRDIANNTVIGKVTVTLSAVSE